MCVCTIEELSDVCVYSTGGTEWCVCVYCMAWICAVQGSVSVDNRKRMMRRG
jgi:hypothetical protein